MKSFVKIPIHGGFIDIYGTNEKPCFLISDIDKITNPKNKVLGSFIRTLQKGADLDKIINNSCPECNLILEYNQKICWLDNYLPESMDKADIHKKLLFWMASMDSSNKRGRK